METIEWIAKYFAEKNWGDGNDATIERQEKAIEEALEFAQQWISVEDELPKKYYEPVIVKDKNGNWDKAVLTGLGWCFENEKTRVKKPTHWRPINLV